MFRSASPIAAIALLLVVTTSLAQVPAKDIAAKAIAKHPELGKVGSPFNVEFMRRLKIHSAEDPQYLTDKTWPLKLSDEVAGVIETYAPKPEIEFKVLLIIKRVSDTWHPLFLPVRAEMTEEEVRTARHCFEIQTPDLVHEATHGKVKLTPTVVVSEVPLHLFNPGRLDSAEYMGDELVNELATLSKPGEYDSVGYYFLHYDTASGYRAPRAGYGVGGFSGDSGIGMFAISCAGSMNPRDEIYLHEWMHGLDGYYGSKGDVHLPKGALHGSGNYDSSYGIAKAWRAQDTFKGYMAWYQDYLNDLIPDTNGTVGLGSKAWKHGPMRDEKRRGKFKTTDLPMGEYPSWVYEMMKGDFTNAQLSPVELPADLKPGAITAGQKPWRLDSWAKSPSTTARYSDAEGGTFTLECKAGDNAYITRDAAVTPAANYVFTAEVKTTRVEIVQSGGEQSIAMECADHSKRLHLAGNTDWTPIFLPLTTKADQSSVSMTLRMGGGGSLTTGKAQFRNVKLQKVGYPATRLIRSASK